MYRYLLLLLTIILQDRAIDQDYAVLAATNLDPTRPARVVPVVVAPQIFDELAVLADTSLAETVRCLMGTDLGDSIFIEVVFEPAIIHSTAHRVRFQRCPAATLAIWHNHVVGPDADPEEACGLSQADIFEALRPGAPKLMIVQVNAEHVCWWSMAQIKELGMLEGLPALPEQRSGSR
jgi:hypothetical protein